jgi:serine/threonine-protein kinase
MSAQGTGKPDDAITDAASDEKTLESRLAPAELALSFAQGLATTIRPPHTGLLRAVAAIDALGVLGGSIDGRIDVHDTLGQGGMGVVHLATQTALGRRVAVKTLRRGAGNHDAALRILREAWVTGAVDHPNVVPGTTWA